MDARNQKVMPPFGGQDDRAVKRWLEALAYVGGVMPRRSQRWHDAFRDRAPLPRLDTILALHQEAIYANTPLDRALSFVHEMEATIRAQYVTTPPDVQAALIAETHSESCFNPVQSELICRPDDPYLLRQAEEMSRGHIAALEAVRDVVGFKLRGPFGRNLNLVTR